MTCVKSYGLVFSYLCYYTSEKRYLSFSPHDYFVYFAFNNYSLVFNLKFVNETMLNVMVHLKHFTV